MPPRSAVLLVSTYELGHAPFALAVAASFLERAGFDVSCFDAAVEPFDAARFARADVIAISTPMHTALRLAMPLLDRINVRIHGAKPAATVGFFGLYASLNARELLDRGAAFVLGGECEAMLVDVVSAIESGASLEPFAPAPPTLKRLDFPSISRRHLPLDHPRYARLVDDGGERKTAYVEASRGCLHMCRHCPIPPVYGGRFFVLPKARVLDDVAAQIDAGASHVTFGDPDFLNAPTHALSIARALHARSPAVTFDFTAKVEHLLRHRARLVELRELGCAFVVSAVESLSDLVLARLEKGHTRDDVVRLVEVMNEAALPVRPTFVPFTPWSTLDDQRALLRFLDEHDLHDHVDPVQLSIRLLVPPGSRLLELEDVRRVLVGEPAPGSFHHPWRHEDPSVDRLSSQIAAIVEDGAAREEPSRATIDRVRLASGLGPGRARARASKRVPHLTEPWFC